MVHILSNAINNQFWCHSSRIRVITRHHILLHRKYHPTNFDCIIRSRSSAYWVLPGANLETLLGYAAAHSVTKVLQIRNTIPYLAHVQEQMAEIVQKAGLFESHGFRFCRPCFLPRSYREPEVMVGSSEPPSLRLRLFFSVVMTWVLGWGKG